MSTTTSAPGANRWVPAVLGVLLVVLLGVGAYLMNRWAEERPGVPKGEIFRHTFAPSGSLGIRTVDVYQTPGFRPRAGSTPVLIMFDGEEVRHQLKAPVILDNLFADGRIPPMAAVFLIQPYDRREARAVSLNDLSEEDRRRVQAMPDPEPLVTFAEAVRTRRRPGGHAEAAHRAATILHLANIAIRVGRRIRFDPVREQIVGDEEANQLVMPPLRAPWHL